MAVAKIYPNRDIVYGASVVTPTLGTTYAYAPPERVIDIPEATGNFNYWNESDARYRDGHWFPEGPAPGSSGDAASATNAAASVVFPAPGSSKYQSVQGVAWSYGAAPTGGNVTVSSSGVSLFSEDVTAAGPGFFDFPPRGLRGFENQDLTLTLAAGGGGVVGKVSAKGHRVV